MTPPRIMVWLLLASAVVGVIAPAAAPYRYFEQHRDCILLPPCARCGVARQVTAHAHWLGTDEYGRDILSRLLYAWRLSALLSTAMAAGALLVAVAAGLGAALWSPIEGAGRFTGELVRSLPWIFVLAGARAALPLDSPAWMSAVVLVGLFSAAAWPVPAWSLRGRARSLMARPFIDAARALGASRTYILRRHLWPNLRATAFTWFALLYAAATLTEASLSMIGLGIADPLPTFGNLLAPLRDSANMNNWWLYAPLLIFTPLLLVLNLLALRHSGELSA